ncbi:CLUMA_CG004297, isoform A [Clunio marinus]|uniref:CLUMA_CG004297, isoform A n=1 Tax=Clunio marinus TaxID=568069 RepID=A0A1J1HRI9_9DIPT|nr:CLUMA_CG004297, isoform A [Clunio marinus]
MKIIFQISIFAFLFAICNASHNIKCEPVTEPGDSSSDQETPDDRSEETPDESSEDTPDESRCPDKCYERDSKIKEKIEEIIRCIRELWRLWKEYLGASIYERFRDWWSNLKLPLGDDVFVPDDDELDPQDEKLERILEIIEKIKKCIQEIWKYIEDSGWLDGNCHPCPPFAPEPFEGDDSHDIWFIFLQIAAGPLRWFIPILPFPLPPILPFPWPRIGH